MGIGLFPINIPALPKTMEFPYASGSLFINEVSLNLCMQISEFLLEFFFKSQGRVVVTFVKRGTSVLIFKMLKNRSLKKSDRDAIKRDQDAYVCYNNIFSMVPIMCYQTVLLFSMSLIRIKIKKIYS